MQTQTQPVSRFIIRQLAQWGIRRIYGVTGDAILPWMDELGKQREIEFVPCRHESAAAMMASAEAKLTGRPAVRTATSGPGTLNLLNGLADAQLDRVPVVAITGQVGTHKLGGNYKQYVNQERLLAPLSWFTTTVASPLAIGEMLHKAFVISMQHRGVAHLAVCKDVFSRQTSNPLIPLLPPTAHQVRTDRQGLEISGERLADAQRPVLLLGVGARRVAWAATELAERIGAGILLSLGAKGAIPDNHPQVLGGIGDGGSKTAMQALGEADLLVILGATWFPRSYIPNGLPILQVDEQPESFHPDPRVFTMLANLEEVLPFRLKRYAHGQKTDRDWPARVRELHANFLEETDDASNLTGSGEIRPQTLIRALQQAVDRDAVIALDTGEHTVWFNRAFRAEAQLPLFSGKWRTMGYSLPAAIAAKLQAPERQVVALVGDGGLMMNVGELAILAERSLPVTVVVADNQTLGLEEYNMRRQGMTPFGTRLVNPDFARLAESFGLRAFSVQTNEQLAGALREAIESGVPALVNVRLTPPTLTPLRQEFVLQSRV